VGWHGVSQAMILDFTLSKQIPRYSDPALNAANPIRNEELLEGLAQMRQDREARRPSDQPIRVPADSVPRDRVIQAGAAELAGRIRET